MTIKHSNILLIVKRIKLLPLIRETPLIFGGIRKQQFMPKQPYKESSVFERLIFSPNLVSVKAEHVNSLLFLINR